MKKLTNAFLWTCTAVLLGQLIIVGMAASKGHFSVTTLTQIVALLSGIDIQGEKIATAVKNGRSVPIPSYEDVLNAKTNAILGTDSRYLALDRYKRQLDEKAQAITERETRHNALVAEFKRKESETKSSRETESIRFMMQMFENLQPADAKQQLLIMLEKSQKAEVISIMKGMDADKLKKILGEFTDPADPQKIADILEEVRLQGKSPDTSER